MDAFAFQLRSGADAFPGRGDLDQQALAADARGFVQRDELVCLRERGGGIEAVASIALGGDAAGDQAEDFASDRDGEAVAGIGDARVGVIAPGFFNRGIDQR